ncbi:MAG: iron-sulfur cluster assembly scaffold protein [Sphingomonadales bacterium]
MSDALYNTQILRLAADIPRLQRLAAPQASVTKVSPICGSRVIVDLSLDDQGRVADYGQEVRACALGQAAASLMAAHVVGQGADDLLALRDAMAAFLKGEDPAPAGAWADLAIFAPAREHKSRHGSIMLPFEAVAAAIRQIRAAPARESA